MKFKPGTEIEVSVGGKPYKTVIDDDGVQRFVKNAVLDHLCRTKAVDLNRLAIDFHAGKFSQRDYAEFNMQLGYSVCGFADLSSFEGMEIVNPLWDDAQRDELLKIFGAES